MKDNLAPPSGATMVDEWDNLGPAFRVFDGPEWSIDHPGHGQPAEIVVSVIGRQYVDGHAECQVVIDCPDTPIIAPAAARQLGRALIAAADAAHG
ncbi:hypothetical protein A5659_18530 [Mycobacterium sp. 1165196.3]|uniref:hypothetical protein n=1 Tax=unclassified Mycobacterium TaxID=2642494 RepID=UPI0007FCD9B5|nr:MULTISPECIES: hypothetical protein [unclassified Mycobacterium]OBJ03053.1 hypothetical protein A5624_04110 [Mycobacterium sp. 1482292.6]OBK12792.1 hypothetical protein A9W96_10540 [Mycobacterium sp. 1245852.3]OBK36635.1 hypothetical protein A5659_18530 [Mycobacterium sp. 1165196.3]